MARINATANEKPYHSPKQSGSEHMSQQSAVDNTS
jgi:hypothetical protein